MASAAIDNGSNSDDDSATGADDIKGFLDTATARHDVFDDEERVTWVDFKAAAKHKAPFFFFGEDVRQLEVASDLVAYDEASEGRRNDAFGSEMGELLSKLGANLGGDGGVLQQQSALEKLATVKARAQEEMALKESAGLAEKFQRGCHGSKERGDLIAEERGRDRKGGRADRMRKQRGLGYRDDFDFNLRASGESRHLDRGAGRERSCEVLLIHGVHVCKSTQVD